MPEKNTPWLIAKLSGLFAPFVAAWDYVCGIPLDRWTYILGVIGGVAYLFILAYDVKRKRKQDQLVDMQVMLVKQQLADHEHTVRAND
jgi:hypothetical protein